MKSQKSVFAVIVVVVVIAAAAVAIAMHGSKKSDTTSSTSSANSTSSTKPTEGSSVVIQGYMFSPGNLKVKVGTTVTWTNRDAVAHTVTADVNSTDAPNSMNIDQNKSYSFTFNKAGTYTYHCTPHPYMKATITVTE